MSLAIRKTGSGKQAIATFLALLFHICGLVGILAGNSFFINATPFTLLLMFLLLVWTQEGKNPAYFLFMLIAVSVGLLAEIFGVNTGLIFGDYTYGSVLGFKIMGVPLVVGLNWCMVVFSSGIVLTTLQQYVHSLWPQSEPAPALQLISLIIDGALMATFFDWIMEPVAMKLGFWNWAGGEIPFSNYAGWMGVSALLMLVFHLAKFRKQNTFAIHLLMIQMMFFLLLRTFL